MQFAEFSPISALVGGALIGLSASLYLLVNGRVAGISGLLSGLLGRERDSSRARVAFLLGLVSTGAVTALIAPDLLGESPRGMGIVVIAGILVGVGTRLANGCTSGHGICGISRGSPASFGATATFVAVGIVTATLVSTIGGGRP
jgi:uncharacterized membrane protein YedE/YeeE